MMLRHNAIREAADLLHDAQRTRRPIGPLTERFPGLDVAAAYAIQQANLNRRTGEGRLVVGHTSWFRRHLRHRASCQLVQTGQQWACATTPDRWRPRLRGAIRPRRRRPGYQWCGG